MKANNNSTTILLLLILILAFSTPFLPATAQSNPEMKVLNPLTGLPTFNFYTNETISGERFNLTVYLYNVSNLFAYQIFLKINDTLLNITRAWLPTWNQTWVFYGKTSSQPAPKFRDDNHNNITELLIIGASLFTGDKFDGDGLLAVVELEIILDPPPGGRFESTLNIDNEDTELFKESETGWGVEPIPVDKYDGEYCYIRGEPPEPWLEITPATLTFGPFPPSIIGETFATQIYVKNLKEQLDLIRIAFTLTFNNSVITISSVNTNPVWQHVTIDNRTQPGEIQLVLESPSSPPKGNMSLTTITFKIIHQPDYPATAESPLTLQTINLTNPSGEISTAPPINGKVIIEGLLSTPWLEVTPNIIKFGPEPFVGKQFNIEIWLKGLNARWELRTITFSLTYNSTLFQVLNVTEGNFLSTFHTTYFQYMVRDEYVNITGGFAGQISTFPEGEGTIAKICFNITRREPAILSFPFNIVNINLLDKNDDPIPIDLTKTKNGYCQLNGVLEPSNITLYLSSSVIETFCNVSISGALTPPKPDVKITLYYKLKEDATWNTLASVITDELSQYQYTWTVNKTGIYQIKAKWQGDAITLAAESEVKTLVVKAPTEEPQPSFPYAMVAIGAIITAIAITVILYIFKKKKLKTSKST